MSIVRGKNVILYIQYNGLFKPIACARTVSLTTTAETGETSSKNTGVWRTYRGRRLSWTANATGLCSEDMNLTIPQLRLMQYNLNAVFINFTATDDHGVVENFSGYAIITNITTSASYNGLYEYTCDLQGQGELVVKDTADDPNQCCDTIWYFYDGVGGEYNTGSISALIGARIDGDIFRDGVAYRPSGALNDATEDPVGKQYKFDPDLGIIYFDTNLPPISQDEQIDIPYLTCTDGSGEGNECTAVSIEDKTLPDAVINQAYNQTIVLSGTEPFTLQPGYTVPTWMSINIIGTGLILAGTPTSTATNQTVSFTILNCSGQSNSFSDTIDVLAKTVFDATTFISGDAEQETEQANIVGPSGCVVTIKLFALIISNADGHILVNGVEKALNDEFTVTLNGSGVGSFTAQVTGDPTDTGSAVLAKFQITSVSTGAVGSTDIYQISKVF